jgi:hypothetical protein
LSRQIVVMTVAVDVADFVPTIVVMTEATAVIAESAESVHLFVVRRGRCQPCVAMMMQARSQRQLFQLLVNENTNAKHALPYQKFVLRHVAELVRLIALMIAVVIAQRFAAMIVRVSVLAVSVALNVVVSVVSRVVVQRVFQNQNVTLSASVILRSSHLANVTKVL